MTIEKINQATTASYAVTSKNKMSETNGDASSKAISQRTIEDTIFLSPMAQRFSNLKASDVLFQFGSQSQTAQEIAKQSSVTDDLPGYISEEDLVKYLEEMDAHAHAQSQVRLSTLDKMNKESGGLFYGTAISNDLSSITTTSGAPHPYADQIQDFILTHQGEWNKLQSSFENKFPSLDEWRAQKG